MQNYIRKYYQFIKQLISYIVFILNTGKEIELKFLFNDWILEVL